VITAIRSKWIRLASLIALFLAMPALAGPAEQAYRKRDLARARKLYEDRLQKHPDDLRSRYNLGNVQFRSSDLKRAEEEWRAALASRDPKVRARAEHNLGNAELKSGRVEDAIRSYVEALRTEPGNNDTKYNLELALQMLKEQQQQQQKRQQQKQDSPKDQDQPAQQPQPNDKRDQEQRQQEQQQQQPQDNSREQDKQPSRPAPGDYSREQAERVLDGLKQEEKDLQADRLRTQGRDLRVEKDW
jgi:Ca-activated chloride channel homolog